MYAPCCQAQGLDYEGSLVTEEPSKGDDDTRRAGRGLLWVTGGKVFFIATATGVSIALPHVFGSEEVFGLYSVAFGAAAMFNAVLISSTLQTVSKLVSEDDAQAPQTLRRALTLQLGIGLGLGGTLLVAAPWLARHVFVDEEFTPLLRVVSGVIFAYALYAALVGYLNGRRRFDRQAQLDMTFSVLRTTGLVGGAALGIGAIGAIAGFAVAAGCILVVALFVVGVGAPGGGVPWKRLLAFLAPIWLYQAALNGIMQIDLQILHYAASDLAREAAEADPSAVADRLCGVYRTAQFFAFVPYQLILSVTFVVFPYVSRATTLGDEEATKRYVRGALRFSVLVLLAVASPIGGAAEGVIRVLFPEPYALGAGALQILVFGMTAFALFVISATIVAGGGRPRLSAAVAVVGLVVVIGATYALVEALGIEGDAALVGTAIGTSLGTGTALLAVGFVVYRSFGAFVPAATAARALLAAAAGFAVARVIPHDPSPWGIVAATGGGLTYLLVLAVTREIGREDLDALKRVIRRGS